MTTEAMGSGDSWIGVRELRQHASRYLRRIEAGESFTVTDRGRPIAQLGPITGRGNPDVLAAQGFLAPAERPTGVLSGRGLPEPLDLGFSGSDELQQLRDEERW